VDKDFILRCAKLTSPLCFADDGAVKDVSAAVVALSPVAAQVRPQVLLDGTYATQAAVAEIPLVSTASAGNKMVNLRSLIISGDMYLGAVVCVSLVKLLLRLKVAAETDGAAEHTVRKRTAECMLVMVSMLRLNEQRPGGGTLALDKDSQDRIVTCMRMLDNPPKDVVTCWLEAYRSAYSASLEEQRNRAAEEADEKAAENACQPDDPIDFAHLKHRRGVSQVCRNRKYPFLSFTFSYVLV
jgi:hypothetical protein